MAWIVLGACVAVVLCGGTFFGMRLASARADALRRVGDDKGANKLDQYRMTNANGAAVPMRIQGFDRPR